MAKPKLYYEVRQTTNPATGQPVFWPAIIDRDQSVTLEDVIKNAIDRGVIAGLKVSAAKQIADAVCQQMYEEFKGARGVKFGNYFYARLYLDGQSDDTGKLTADNHINVRFVNGAGFKLDRADFSFEFANSDVIPSVQFLISDKNGAQRDNIEWSDAPVMVNGNNLYAEDDTATKVSFYKVDSESGVIDTNPTVEIDTADFTSRGPNLLVFTPTESSDMEGKFVARVTRTLIDGKSYESGNHAITVTQ
jgi:hypothetical protein